MILSTTSMDTILTMSPPRHRILQRTPVRTRLKQKCQISTALHQARRLVRINAIGPWTSTLTIVGSLRLCHLRCPLITPGRGRAFTNNKANHRQHHNQLCTTTRRTGTSGEASFFLFLVIHRLNSSNTILLPLNSSSFHTIRVLPTASQR